MKPKQPIIFMLQWKNCTFYCGDQIKEKGEKSSRELPTRIEDEILNLRFELFKDMFRNVKIVTKSANIRLIVCPKIDLATIANFPFGVTQNGVEVRLDVRPN